MPHNPMQTVYIIIHMYCKRAMYTGSIYALKHGWRFSYNTSKACENENFILEKGISKYPPPQCCEPLFFPVLPFLSPPIPQSSEQTLFLV